MLTMRPIAAPAHRPRRPPARARTRRRHWPRRWRASRPRSISSIGRPTCPRTPPAALTRMSSGRRAPTISSTSAGGGLAVRRRRADARVHAVRLREALTPSRVDVGDMDARAAFGKRDGDRLADALRGAGYERDAAVEADVHVSISSWNVSNDSGRRPSSMSWIRRDQPVDRRRRDAGLARRASPMMPICGSTSVLRLRTARSRQMPEWVLAVWRCTRRAPRSLARDSLRAGAGREGRRVESVEADRRDAARRGDRDDLAAERGRTRRSAAGRRNSPTSSRRSARSRTASRHRRACPRDSPRCCRSAPRRARRSRSSACIVARALARSRRRSRRPRPRRGCRTGCCPGPCQSAPKLTKQPMVRSAPTLAAIAISLSPFCAESTKPSGARCGASASSAASVAGAFTASTMRR